MNPGAILEIFTMYKTTRRSYFEGVVEELFNFIYAATKRIVFAKYL